MKNLAVLLITAAILAFSAGCRFWAPPPSAAVVSADFPPGGLAPSPRLLVGRVIALDAAQGFAILELTSDAPAEAASDGTELIARTLDLRETARLRASRQLRGRILGANIVAGQPTPGDEVVWLAP